MGRIRVEQIVFAREHGEALSCHLDEPSSGLSCSSGGLPISGWVVFDDARDVRIQLVSDGRVLATLPRDRMRPDVAAQFALGSECANLGFRGQVGLHTVGEKFSLNVMAVDRDGVRFRLATIHGRQESVWRPADPGCAPLLVMGMGRSGTTWLMRLLSMHPAMVADVRYPYETRVAQYYAHVFKVLSDPADFARPDDRVHFVQEPEVIRANPFFDVAGVEADWFGVGYRGCLETFIRETVIGYYRMLAGRQSKGAIRYFAEKAFHARPTALDAVFPATKRVFIVRDLRDVFCSARAFNDKRGVRHFGRENAKDDEGHIDEMGRRAERFLVQWKNSRDTRRLVRYEDLLLRPAETLERLFESLDVDCDRRLIESLLTEAVPDTPEMADHRTTADPASSVGRWRSDLDEALIARCNRVFGNWNEAFSYVQ